MIGSFNIECSGCGYQIDLHRAIEGIDYVIEDHDGEQCVFCKECT
jgi:hypothetical protein